EYLGFFFQAEDGIRDFHVTGVQTCALPISGRAAQRAERSPQCAGSAVWVPRIATKRPRRSSLMLQARSAALAIAFVPGASFSRAIGRASCRESAMSMLVSHA